MGDARQATSWCRSHWLSAAANGGAGWAHSRGRLGFVGLLPPLAGMLAAGAAAASGEVRVVRIADTLDAGLAPYLARASRDAEAERAAAVILEINAG